MANGVKTTLSVREMGKILGLKKVESYYLVRKGYFETIIVEGKMRVVRSSFEAWYANQDRYRKIEGEPPGKKLRETSWSAKDAAEHLAISIDLMYTIIRRDRLKTILIDGVNRIPRDEFDKWYGKQDRYRNPADRARDAEMEAASMTMPEMARLLNISRGDVYRIIREDKGRTFQMITIAGKKRILLDSFEKWYAGQNKYSKFGGTAR